MGSGLSQSQELDKFYHRFSIIHRDAVKNVLYIQEKKTGREFVLRELTTNDQIQKRLIEVLVQEKRSTRNKFLVRLEDHFFANSQNYCSSQFKAYLLFESHYKDLREEILDRRNKGSYFQEDQLFSIVESGCMGLKYLRQINQPHQAVCSSSILINREGVVMLTDPWLTSDHTNTPNSHSYMSPQKLQTINNTRTGYDWYTSDLFSLGMVVLEAANLEYMDEIYQPNFKDINYHLLDSKIKNIRSPRVKSYVERLLRSEKFRLDVVQQITFQVKNGTKPTQTSYSQPKVIQSNRIMTTTTNMIEPVIEKQISVAVNVEIPEQRVIQSIVPNQQIKPPQPRARVYSNIVNGSTGTIPLNSPPAQIQNQTISKFYAPNILNQQNFQTQQTPFPFKQTLMVPPVQQNLQTLRQTKQKVETLPRRQRVDSAGTVKQTAIQQKQQPVVNIKPFTQQRASQSAAIFKNIEVRNRSIDHEKVGTGMKKDITFNYSSNTTTTTSHLIMHKSMMGPTQNTITNGTATNLRKTQTNAPSFIKKVQKNQGVNNIPKIQIQAALSKSVSTSNLVAKDSPRENGATLNSASLIRQIQQGPTSTPPTAASSGLKIPSPKISMNTSPIYEAKQTTSSSNSSYEGPSFIKKVPPLVSPPTLATSINNTQRSWQYQQSTPAPSLIVTKGESFLKSTYESDKNVALLASSASKINDILNSQINPVQSENKIEMFIKQLHPALKKTTDTLTISTSKQPEAYNFNLTNYECSSPEKTPQIPIVTQTTNSNNYEFFIDREPRYEAKYDQGAYVYEYLKEDVKSFDKNQTESHSPAGSYQVNADYMFQYPINSWKKQEKSLPYGSQFTATAYDYAPVAPIIPRICIPTETIAPTIHSERGYRNDFNDDMKRMKEQNLEVYNRAAKTQRIFIKPETQEINVQNKPIQTIVNQKEQAITEKFSPNYTIPQQIPKHHQFGEQRQKSQPISIQYNPSYEIPHSSSIYMGRVEQPAELISEPKYLLSYDMEQIKPAPKVDIRVSEVEIDTSQQGKSSIAQESLLNNSSKSLINAMNMTEPPPPAFLLQNPAQHQQVLKPVELNPQPVRPVEAPQQQSPPPVAQQAEATRTPSRPRGNHFQKYNSTIAEVSESDNSGEIDEQDSEYVIQEYEVGSRYEGYKKNGMRNGKGKFYYQDGGYYEGEWKDNKMHGEGKLYYSQSKLAYEGEWYLDEFHGHGKVYNDNPIMLDGPFNYKDFDELDEYWVYYEGNLITDTKEGLGRLKLSNGEVFQGEFKYDRIEGRGRFVTMSGEVINGIWKDSKLVKVL